MLDRSDTRGGAVAAVVLLCYLTLTLAQDATADEPLPAGTPYWHNRVGTHHAHFHNGDNSNRYTHHYKQMKNFYASKDVTPSETVVASNDTDSPAAAEGGAADKLDAKGRHHRRKIGPGHKGEVVFQPDGSSWQTQAMIKLLNGTATDDSWINSFLVQHEYASFQAQCEPNGFVDALTRYIAVYYHTLDPKVPAAEKRFLVVRDALARTGVGLGIQMLFYAKFLLLGMATDRAVFFQYCRDGEGEEEDWVELGEEGNRFGTPVPLCEDDPSYDMGDFFGLLGGIDLRWTPARARALKQQGAVQNVVSSCSTDVDLQASPPRRFICNCCNEECAAKFVYANNNNQRAPIDVFKAVSDFWTKGEADHIPWITFEYRASCGKGGMQWRYDTRKHWYVEELGDILDTLAMQPAPKGCAPGAAAGARCVSGGVLREGWARTRPWSRITTYDNLAWADCARFAMFTPTPTIQHILSLPSMLPKFGGPAQRLVAALHIRTLAVDDPRCFASDANLTWAAMDAEFDLVDHRGGPAMCRRGPSWCLDAQYPFAFFLTDPFGGLSGLFHCAERLNTLPLPLKRKPEEYDHELQPMLMATSDAESLQAFLKVHYGKGMVVTEGDRIMALWNNVNKQAAIKNRLGRTAGEPGADEELSAGEVEAGWLKGALDIYMLGLADVIFAPVPSFFTNSAAMRSMPPTPIVGLHDDLCKLFASYEEGGAGEGAWERTAMGGLAPCFTKVVDLEGDHLRATLDALTELADAHEDPNDLENLRKDRQQHRKEAAERAAG